MTVTRPDRGSGVSKIGTLESVYVGTGTDELATAAMRISLPTRHRLTFVPLDRGDLRARPRACRP
ncbi:hypothetical protein [Actinomadura roseirufa]|uniref:hypothetical protein n=1 Tax=Actinomadura roseirufa TaxID=2094049 RepID=UPI001A954626|nr:hypothetical protein [Actinomadura roseirufa]